MQRRSRHRVELHVARQGVDVAALDVDLDGGD